MLLLRHRADTQHAGAMERTDEWTGGTEQYTLSEEGRATTLVVEFDVPESMKSYFTINYPKAMDKIKSLAEA
jgi:hypothetical protein